MLSRSFLRVSRPANPYVCLSCLARGHSLGEQTRLQSSITLHPNGTPSDIPFAFNGTENSRTTAESPKPEHPATKIKAKKPTKKTRETPQDAQSHSDKGEINVKGNAEERREPANSSEDSQPIKKKKKAAQLEPSRLKGKRRDKKRAQKSTISEDSPLKISARDTQQSKVTKTKEKKAKEANQKPATSPEESGIAKNSKSHSKTQSTAQREQPAKASDSTELTATSPDLKTVKQKSLQEPRIKFFTTNSPQSPPKLLRRRRLTSVLSSPDAIKRLASPLRVRSRLRSREQDIEMHKQRASPRKLRIRAFSKEGKRGIKHTEHAPSIAVPWGEGHLTLKEALTGHRGAKGKALGIIERLSPEDLRFKPLNVQIPPVPMLAHGLDRVLFNPGIYHLQDPRSRVYNFDPYLEKIMPAAEFDFDALSKYMTSSKDKGLINMAKEIGAKYTGSTSSMSGALTHFHYLLSQWRPLNLKMLSKEFPEISNNFSKIQRAPAAIFLRWKDGTYAIDADKEFDTPNIMSWLGQSMEKLLTNPADEFERYRKSNPEEAPREDDSGPKSFHYSKQGSVLMRSQLDAYDPRLPGTGVFDLKTRAVVSVRMDSAEYEQRSGYQIRYPHGEWESFEREYFDMARATMLKYSLQVRMGRMDGIFVAYHNVERIFGFQYISLPNMDLTLHGQSNTCLGDQEFKSSVELLNKVLERATTKFPEQSIRLHFETRETKIPFMYIFAEPVTEGQVEEIQNKSAEQMLEFERSIGLGSSNVTREKTREEWQKIKAQVEAETEQDRLAEDVAGAQDDEQIPDSASTSRQASAESNLPAEDFVERDELSASYDLTAEQAIPEQEGFAKEDPPRGINISEEEVANWVTAKEVAERTTPTRTELIGNTNTAGEAEDNSLDPTPRTILDSDNAATTTSSPTKRTPILGFTLTIRNRVNGQYVVRPKDLTPDDTWSIEYSLDEIAGTNDRDMLIYSQVKRRRASELSFEKKAEDKAFDHYRSLLAKYSEKGRDWRRKQDEIDASMGVKVYRPLGDDSKEVIRKQGPWFIEERINGVDDYLMWLYGNTRINVQLTKSQAAENKEDAAMDDVNGYLGWLYGRGVHEG